MEFSSKSFIPLYCEELSYTAKNNNISCKYTVFDSNTNNFDYFFYHLDVKNYSFIFIIFINNENISKLVLVHKDDITGDVVVNIYYDSEHDKEDIELFEIKLKSKLKTKFMYTKLPSKSIEKYTKNKVRSISNEDDKFLINFMSLELYNELIFKNTSSERIYQNHVVNEINNFKCDEVFYNKLDSDDKLKYRNLFEKVDTVISHLMNYQDIDVNRLYSKLSKIKNKNDNTHFDLLNVLDNDDYIKIRKFDIKQNQNNNTIYILTLLDHLNHCVTNSKNIMEKPDISLIDLRIMQTQLELIKKIIN